MDTAAGFEQHRRWERTLYDGGWAAVSWPVEYGGRGADLVQWLIFEEEYWRAGAPGRVNQNGVFLLGPTIMEFGTDAQKAELLPRMASGTDIWCQGWSEPNAGSDLAGIRSRGVRDARRVGAHRPEDVVLARRVRRLDVRDLPHRPGGRAPSRPHLHPRAARHRGHHRASHRAARRRDGLRGGLPGGGTGARDQHPRRGGRGLGRRHGYGRLRAGRQPAQSRPASWRRPRRLVELYRRRPASRRTATRSRRPGWTPRPTAPHATGRCRACSTAGTIGAEASLNKIFWSEMDLRMHETALQLLGLHGELRRRTTVAGSTASCSRSSGPIYAGTNEIQRNVIAERVLGLPRS